jgi:hypothetical protein
MPFDHAEQSDPGVAQMDWGYLTFHGLLLAIIMVYLYQNSRRIFMEQEDKMDRARFLIEVGCHTVCTQHIINVIWAFYAERWLPPGRKAIRLSCKVNILILAKLSHSGKLTKLAIKMLSSGFACQY